LKPAPLPISTLWRGVHFDGVAFWLILAEKNSDRALLPLTLNLKTLVIKLAIILL